MLILVLGCICKKINILDYKKSTSSINVSFVVKHEEEYFRSDIIKGPCSKCSHKVHDTLHHFCLYVYLYQRDCTVELWDRLIYICSIFWMQILIATSNIYFEPQISSSTESSISTDIEHIWRQMFWRTDWRIIHDFFMPAYIKAISGTASKSSVLICLPETHVMFVLGIVNGYLNSQDISVTSSRHCL